MARNATDTGSSQSLPVLYTSGTHYQVGFEMGRTFRSHIQSYCDQCSALNDLLLPYYRSGEGREVYEEYWKAMREFYPQYEDELRGIADSCGVEYHKIFLLHINAEVLGLLGKQATATGCSDLMLNYIDIDGKQHSIMAHNEDGDWLVGSLAYVVYAHIKPDPQLYPHLPEEHFVSYAYPGRLTGHTMSANHHGVTMSINVLFPKRVVRKRTAIYTLTRVLASAHSLEHAQAIIADDPLGCGYGFRYQHFTEVEQQEDHSSVQRERTVNDRAWMPSDLPSILAVLGSKDHPVFPIFRNGNPPDTLATFATSVFDLLKGTFSIYVNNPSSGSEPIVSFPVMQCPQVSP